MYRIFHTTVFANAPAGGNPCPVILDADLLSTEEMQKMTKSFGFESVFILESLKQDCDFHLKYFVPLHEMEMCVHATIAATTILVLKNRVQKHDLYYETLLGNIHVRWMKDNGNIKVQVWQFLPQKQSITPSVSEICHALQISDDMLADYPIASYSTSRFKLMVPIKSREIMDAITPNFSLIKEVCKQYQTTGFYPFTMEKHRSDVCIYARQFPQNSGYPEDAATGVAASALGNYLVENQIISTHDGWNIQKIYQGQAMGHPSLLESKILIENNKIKEVCICGCAQIIQV